MERREHRLKVLGMGMKAKVEGGRCDLDLPSLSVTTTTSRNSKVKQSGSYKAKAEGMVEKSSRRGGL